MKIRQSTKILLYKAIHILLIVALLVPLLPRAGFAQPLPVQKDSGPSVEEAFALLNAEIESYLPKASPLGNAQADERASWPFDPFKNMPTSPWEMLPDAPERGVERAGVPVTGANGAQMGLLGRGGDDDRGAASFLPQPLDPNAQNAALLESILPMLVDMPPAEGDGAAEEDEGEAVKVSHSPDEMAALAPEAPVGTTPTPAGSTGTPARSTGTPARSTPQPLARLPTIFDDDIIGEGELVERAQAASGVVGATEAGRSAEGGDSVLYLPLMMAEQASNQGGSQVFPDASSFVAVDPCAVDVQVAPEFPFVYSENPMATFHSGSVSFNHYPGTLVYLAPQQSPPGDATPADFGTVETKDLAVLTFPNGAMNITSSSNVQVTDQFAPYPFVPLPFAIPGLFPPPIPANVSIQMNDPTPRSNWGSTAYYLVRDDITNPQITYGYSLQDGFGGVYVLINVFDNCAIDRVEISYSSSSGGGGTKRMTYLGGFGNGGGFYATRLSLPVTGVNSYTITAYDMASPIALTDVWTTDENSMNDRDAGDRCTDSCNSQCGCVFGHGVLGDPVDTATGNFTYKEEDAVIPGVSDLTDIAIRRQYNSVKVERYFKEPHEDGTFDNGTIKWLHSPFGLGWSSDQYFFVEIMDNLMLQGAKVNYPDGHSSRYQGSSGVLTSLSAGESDILEATGGGYVLTQKDLTKHQFDGQGRLLKTTDANGNWLEYTQSANGPTTITNSGGRSINLTYSVVGGQSVITSITDGSGLLNLSYTYQAASKTDELGITRTGALLASSTDSRGQTTQYSYDGNHYLTGLITPKGHNALQLQYDTNGRVLQQTIGTGETYSITYDDANQKRTIVDANGHSEVHQYNSDYFLTSLQDNRGFVESYTYTGQNLRQSQTKRNSENWSYSYDARHNLLRTDGPLGWSLEFTYNAQDRPLTMTDPEGRTTNFAYDGAGNLTSVTNADGNTMTIAYDRGLPATITDFNGNVIVNTYDAAGDLTQVQNAEGEVLTIAYDGLGRMNSMTTDEGHNFTFAYDGGSDLMATLAGGLGYSAAYSYDANGNLASQTDAEGHATTYEYDGSENLVKVTDALSGVMSFAYDNMNNLTTQTDELGRVTTYAYDEIYNLIEINTPENRKTTLTYDEVSNLTTITDAEGRVTSLTYDELDRLVKITDALNGDTSITYDKVGNVLSITLPNGHVTTYQIDVLDRTVSETNAENEVTQYDYDKNSNLIAIVDAEGNRTELAYDQADRMTKMTNAESEVVGFAYDSFGNIVDLVQPNNVSVHWVYDALYRPTELTQNFVSSGVSNADTNVTYQLAYDLNSNLTQLTDAENNSTTFEYDALNRLTRTVNALGHDIQYEYDKVDNLSQVTNRRGYATQLVYDEADRLIETINAQGNHSYLTYDRVDNLLTHVDENGHTTTMSYDVLGRLDTITNPEGDAVDYDYDAVGNLTQITDANGHATTYAYDMVNRVVQITDTLGGVTQLVYDDVGNVLELIDANNHKATTQYDRVYRPRIVTDAEGYTTEYQYDLNGRVTRLIDGGGNATDVAYDALDRVISVTNAESETTRFTYDKVGNLLDTIEADGVTKRYGYDAIYQMTSVMLNAGGMGLPQEVDVSYNYEYDESGNLTTVSDPLAHVTSFAYDELDQVTSKTNPLGSVWQYQYDAIGNLTQRTDANGHVTRYSYFDDDQLQRIVYDDSTSVALSYDANNNLTSMLDSLGTTSFVYDDLNRITNVNDALGRTLAYTYDAVGNQTSITYPHGGTVNYSYYDNDWLHTLTDTSGGVNTYERNRVGQMTRTWHSNGAETVAVYDKANRLLSQEHWEDAREDLIQATYYTLNDVGLRSEAQIVYGRPWPQTTTEQYEYDGLRRLTNVSDNTGFQSSYEYDAVGNRVRWEANDDQTTLEVLDGFVTTYSYNTGDQLVQSVHGNETTRYTYDANGNRTNKHQVITGHPYQYGSDYAYDREDRLTWTENYRVNDSLNPGHRRNREQTLLTYDGMGRRLSKEYREHENGIGRVAQTEYALDGFEIVAEYPVYTQGEFVGRNNHRNEFYLNDEREIVTQRRFPNGVAAQEYQYHYDGRRNVVSLTEETNRAWVHYQYDAYGQRLPDWGNSPHPEHHDHNHYTLAGREFDVSTDSYDFGARSYDSQVGGWLTQDPFSGVTHIPQTLHNYQYIHSTPINGYDVGGYFWSAIGGALKEGASQFGNEYKSQVESNLWTYVKDGGSLRDAFTSVDFKKIGTGAADKAIGNFFGNKTVTDFFSKNCALCGSFLKSAASPLVSGLINGDLDLENVLKAGVKGSVVPAISKEVSSGIVDLLGCNSCGKFASPFVSSVLKDLIDGKKIDWKKAAKGGLKSVGKYLIEEGFVAELLDKAGQKVGDFISSHIKCCKTCGKYAGKFLKGFSSKLFQDTMDGKLVVDGKLNWDSFLDALKAGGEFKDTKDKNDLSIKDALEKKYVDPIEQKAKDKGNQFIKWVNTKLPFNLKIPLIK